MVEVLANKYLDGIIGGDEGEFGYLFPNRDRVPKIRDHLFSDIRQNTETIDRYIVSKMLDPSYIGWTAKVLLNIDLFPMQITTLQLLWRTTFPMLIASRGGSKSFMLAVYAILRALLDQGSKIVIVGAGLRQAKLVFGYIEQIWNRSPILRNIVGVGKRSGPRQNVDLCYFTIGDSIIYALPLGDGCLSPYTTMTYDDCFGYISDDQAKNQVEKTIIERRRQIWGNGQFRMSDESYCNGKSETKKMKTHHGFEIEGTYNHKLKIVRDQRVVWVRIDEVRVGDKILLDRSVRWHDGDVGVTDEEAYALGLLAGDGSYAVPDRIGFATQDEELAIAVKKLVPIRQIPSDPVHWILSSRPQRKSLFSKFGINQDHIRTKDKQFPSTILKSSREVTSAFISGLFDTDGHVQVQSVKGGTGITVGFTNTSKELVRQLQYILLHYGIVAHVGSRKRDENWEECYELLITGKDVLIFATEIGFRLRRKQEKLLDGIDKKKRWMDQGDSIPDVLEDMIDISENNRAQHNTGNCVSVCAGRLKVKKSVSRPLVENFLRVYGHLDDERIENIRDLANPDIYYDEIVSIEDSECVTFDVHVPDGHEYCANGFYSHNTKIRGFRATVVIADEFAAIPEDVFDIVVRGFAATTKTPVDEAKKKSIERKLRQAGIPTDVIQSMSDKKVQGNQIIYSGTAYYQFNHFAKKFDTWKAIIHSGGDRTKLSNIFGGANMIPDNFSIKDYAVIRIPCNHLPEGLLDLKQLAHAKALLPNSIYLMEYGAVFIKDSDGFFTRSLIEGCTCAPGKPIATPDGDVVFTPLMRGVKGNKYVMGIDPAAERDNLAISIIEVRQNHYRVVYCWAVNKSIFEKRKAAGLVGQKDYYEYCCHRIREICKLFGPERIEMDSQGGGYPISEMLRNKKLLDAENNDFPIYEVIDPDEPKETDGEVDGRHILHLVKQSSEFNAQANVCLHKNFETRSLLFPAFDTVKMQGALIAETSMDITFDTYEENVSNIEEMKNELCTIHMSETSTGKEKFDTPTVVQPGAVEGRQRKGRLRKDRYTSLLLAHKYIFDNEVTHDSSIDYEDVAGNIHRIKGLNANDKMYRGIGAASMQGKGPNQGAYGATQAGERL